MRIDSELRMQVAALSWQLKKLNEYYAQRETAYEGITADNVFLKAEKNNLQSENDSLKSEIAHLKQVIENQENDSRQDRDQIDRLSAEIAELTTANAASTQKKNKMGILHIT